MVTPLRSPPNAVTGHHDDVDISSFRRRHEQEIASLKAKFGHGNCGAVAEAMNSLGLHYHFLTDEHDLSLECHLEALAILRRAAVAESAASVSMALLIGEEAAPTAWVSGEGDGNNNNCTFQPPSTASVIAPSEKERLLGLDIAATLTDIGNALKRKGDLVGAMRSYQDALDTYRSLGMDDDNFRVSATLRCIDNIHKSTGIHMHGCKSSSKDSADDSTILETIKGKNISECSSCEKFVHSRNGSLVEKKDEISYSTKTTSSAFSVQSLLTSSPMRVVTKKKTNSTQVITTTTTTSSLSRDNTPPNQTTHNNHLHHHPQDSFTAFKSRKHFGAYLHPFDSRNQVV